MEHRSEFRFAGKEDMGKILFFIEDLAAYEGRSDEVIATKELLHEWIFEKKKAEVILAVEDSKANSMEVL